MESIYGQRWDLLSHPVANIILKFLIYIKVSLVDRLSVGLAHEDEAELLGLIILMGRQIDGLYLLHVRDANFQRELSGDNLIAFLVGSTGALDHRLELKSVNMLRRYSLDI